MDGIDYFGVEVNIAESDEFINLIIGAEHPTAGWAVYGRLMALLAVIYSRGFYIELTPAQSYRLAKHLDLDAEGLDSLVETLVAAGWFDPRLWEDRRALTSKGIQRRWLRPQSGRGHRKPAISGDEAALWLLDPELVAVEDGQGPSPADSHSAAESDSNGVEITPKSRPNRAQIAPKSRPNGSEIGGKCDVSDSFRMISPPQEKEKEKVKRKEEKEKDKRTGTAPAAPDPAPSPLGRGEGIPLGCMSRLPSENGCGFFLDTLGRRHETALEAIMASHADATATPCGGPDWRCFSAEIAETCPNGCRGEPARCGWCFRAIKGALADFDPDRARTPVPLVRAVLAQGRGSAR